MSRCVLTVTVNVLQLQYRCCHNINDDCSLAGRDETMQPSKPSFLEYFEQKEKEANSHNDGGGKGDNYADNRKLPAEGDLQVVS